MSDEQHREQQKLWRESWKRFKRNRLACFSLWFLAGMVLIALLAPILANEQPLYCKYKGNTLFPAFSPKSVYLLEDEDGRSFKLQSDITNWKQLELESVVWAPITYSPGKSDKYNRYLNADYTAPSADQQFHTSGGTVVLRKRFWHWLGTGKKGEDLLSGLIHGTRVSLIIGVAAMALASVLGLLLGSLAGYYGDEHFKTKRGVLWASLVGVGAGWYYGFHMRAYALSDSLAKGWTDFSIQLIVSLAFFAIVWFGFRLIGWMLAKAPGLDKEVRVPLDGIISRTIEVLMSIPRLVLIIALTAIISKPSVFNVVLIIGLTSWTTIARLVRAEFFKVRELDYVEAARALGYKDTRLMWIHALPNAMAPVIVAIAFGVASAILVESGLSFLNIGVPTDTVTWGKLLALGQQKFSAWWMVVFPGLAIFITVTLYNLLGEGLRDALDPKMKGAD